MALLHVFSLNIPARCALQNIHFVSRKTQIFATTKLSTLSQFISAESKVKCRALIKKNTLFKSTTHKHIERRELAYKIINRILVTNIKNNTYKIYVY